jgi:hypothetical protein
VQSAARESQPISFLTLPHISYYYVGKIIVDLGMFWTHPASAVLAEEVPRIVSASAVVAFPETCIVVGH